jgi:hypothetical protein
MKKCIDVNFVGLTLFLALLTARAASEPALEGQYIEISAEIKQTNYSRHGNGMSVVEKPRVYHVDCIISTNAWKIQTGYIPYVKDVWCYDGTNVYRGLGITNTNNYALEEAVISKMKHPPRLVDPQSSLSNETISIYSSPGGHPLGHPGINIPWLAFCSGGYLKEKDRVIPLPCVDIRIASDAFAYNDRTETFDDNFGLPKKIDLLTSKSRYLKGLEDQRNPRDGRVARVKRLGIAPSVADGEVRFHYEVLTSTNFRDWNCPITFYYVQYRKDKLTGWQPEVSGVGTVNNVHEQSPFEGTVFDSGKSYTARDYRFRHPTKVLDSISYTVTNPVIPPTNDPLLQAKFALAAEHRPAIHAMPASKVRFVFFTLVVILAILPLIYVFEKLKRKLQ